MVSSRHNSEPQGKSKNLIGNKRPGPPGPPRSNKNIKRFPDGLVSAPVKNASCVMDEKLRKECNQILTKLLKHKAGWIFKAPVDAKALNLHDYHLIVKRPMDLGTVKTNLSNNLYQSPIDFATDVRLTFNNAKLYNPITDEVHGLAKMLLSRFEDFFRPIQDKIDISTRDHMGGDGGMVDELQGSSWNHIATPERFRKQKTNPIFQKQDRMQSQSSASTPSHVPPQPITRPKAPSPVPVAVSTMNSPVVSPTSPLPLKQQASSQALERVKLPKPKAKDTNKREMSMEEKHKLGEGLQSLPQEKMPQLVQIIRKRTESLAEEGDEIELDIQALDTETLWELDRFVTNCKKTESKTKRQALMTTGNNPTADINDSAAEIDQFNTSAAEVEQFNTSIAEVDEEHVNVMNDSAKKPKRREIGDEEDIDVDDDMPITSFPTVEIEKDEAVGLDIVNDNGNGNGNGNDTSSSSSSSSASSSSSDSDSGSSSGSDSDAAAANAAS